MWDFLSREVSPDTAHRLSWEQIIRLKHEAGWDSPGKELGVVKVRMRYDTTNPDMEIL